MSNICQLRYLHFETGAFGREKKCRFLDIKRRFKLSKKHPGLEIFRFSHFKYSLEIRSNKCINLCLLVVFLVFDGKASSYTWLCPLVLYPFLSYLM